MRFLYCEFDRSFDIAEKDVLIAGTDTQRLVNTRLHFTTRRLIRLGSTLCVQTAEEGRAYYISPSVVNENYEARVEETANRGPIDQALFLLGGAISLPYPYIPNSPREDFFTRVTTYTVDKDHPVLLLGAPIPRKGLRRFFSKPARHIVAAVMYNHLGKTEYTISPPQPQNRRAIPKTTVVS